MIEAPRDQERVELWRRRDGFWGWRYRDPHVGVELPSAELYGTRAEAVRAARSAYPGVPMVAAANPETRGGLSRLLWGSAAALAAVSVLRRPVRLFRWFRRWRRRLSIIGSKRGS